MISLNCGHLTEYGQTHPWVEAIREWRRDELLMEQRRREFPNAIMGAGSFNDYWEEQVAKLTVGGEVAKITGRLALCTTAPTDASTGITIVEAGYTGYARLEIPFAKWTISGTTPTVVKTNEEMKFAACTASSSTIIAWAWTDNATKSEGHAIAWGTATSATISTTQTPATIASGGLEITVD